MLTLSRRRFLHALGGLLMTTVGARTARADASLAARRRFVVIFNQGGWDPLTVFAPLFGSPQVQMGDGAQTMAFGDATLVDHAGRPTVRAFFQDWGRQTAIINGVSVPSVSHEVCTLLSLTGSTGGDRSDWSTLLASVAGDTFSLPSLVLNGPSFPGTRGVYSARVGAVGQLQTLLDGSALFLNDTEVPPPLFASHDRIDAFVRGRVEQAAAESPSALVAELHAATQRAEFAADGIGGIDLTYVGDLNARVDTALQTLDAGLCRVVSLSSGGYGNVSWDSHTNNETQQTQGMETLFQGLDRLMTGLRDTPTASGTLLDETTVVVLSEMGRTPIYNPGNGRDHWPFTSAMLLGSGVRGQQVASGYDDGFYGLGYDAANGVADPDAPTLTSENIGATLLALADIDPAEFLPGVSPIRAVMAQ